MCGVVCACWWVGVYVGLRFVRACFVSVLGVSMEIGFYARWSVCKIVSMRVCVCVLYVHVLQFITFRIFLHA